MLDSSSVNQKAQASAPSARAWRKDSFFFLIALAVLGLDQLSKYLVRATLSQGESVPDGWPVRFTYVTNSGGAFGFFSNQTFLLTVAAVVAVAIILLYYRYALFQGVLLRTCLGLQLGGAAGNLFDRLRFGQVTDFIDVQVWPVFNLADSAIVVGVVLLAYAVVEGNR